MKSYICLLFNLFLLYSCAENVAENEKAKVYVFDKNKVEELAEVQIPMDSAILLDSAVAMTFPNNTCIAVDGDYLFCYTREWAYTFDKQGHCLNKIGNMGHGRGEYVQVWDLALDKKEKQVVILDNSAILRYDYNGEFVAKQKLELPVASLAWNDNEYWLASGNSSLCGDFELYEMDKELNRKGNYIERKYNIPMDEDNFGKGTIATYRNSFSHNIYHIAKGEVTLAYRISIPNREMLESFTSNDVMKVAEALETESYALIRTFVENDDFIYMLLYEHVAEKEEMSFYHWMINKKTSEERIIRFDETMASTFHFNPQVLTDDNKLLFVGYSNTTGDDESMCINVVNLPEMFSKK